MIITTTNSIHGREVEKTFGLVEGSAIRARHLGSDIASGLKSLIGGELMGYTKLMEETRSQAIERMETAAKNMGADAIVGVRITTSMIMQGASEILAYGTAVKLK
ncbi:MAG: YbjQ family protein [Patescibacteria group bacterium]